MQHTHLKGEVATEEPGWNGEVQEGQGKGGQDDADQMEGGLHRDNALSDILRSCRVDTETRQDGGVEHTTRRSARGRTYQYAMCMCVQRGVTLGSRALTLTERESTTMTSNSFICIL